MFGGAKVMQPATKRDTYGCRADAVALTFKRAEDQL
jgi:hypothetical protein